MDTEEGGIWGSEEVEREEGGRMTKNYWNGDEKIMSQDAGLYSNNGGVEYRRYKNIFIIPVEG